MKVTRQQEALMFRTCCVYEKMEAALVKVEAERKVSQEQGADLIL